MSQSPFAAPAVRFDPRWLAAGLIGPLVGLGLILIAVVQAESNSKPLDYFTIGLVFGTIFGHVMLAGAWTALGPLPLVWRLPLALGWLAALVVALAINTSINGPRGDLGILVLFGGAAFGQWLLAQVPLWGLALGYGLCVRPAAETGLAQGRKDRQFGIRQLLIVTAIVAVVLGIGRAIILGLVSNVEIPYGAMIIVSFLAVAGIIMMLPLVLAALLPQHAVPASLLVLLLIGLGTAAELPVLTSLAGRGPGTGPEMAHFYGINGFQCFWVLAVIGALRMAGYGLASVKQ